LSVNGWIGFSTICGDGAIGAGEGRGEGDGDGRLGKPEGAGCCPNALAETNNRSNAAWRHFNRER
jgi:hypothetical protein